jgi:adenylate cyclase
MVKRSSNAANDDYIFYNGQVAEEFNIVPGEGFVIGRTIFQLQSPRMMQDLSGPSASSRTQFFEIEHLKTQLITGDDHLQIVHGLQRQLWERKLDVAAFEMKVLEALKQFVKRTDFAGIIHWKDGELQVTSSLGEVSVCQPLVEDAIQMQKLVAHRWGSKAEATYPSDNRAAWAVCAPILASIEVDGDYAVYMSGAKTPVSNLKSEHALPSGQLAFIAIVADILRHAYSLSNLAEQKKSIEVFLPKNVLDQILVYGPDHVLKTEEVDAAILFCDLRGSSQFAEQKSHDLLAAWNTISEALSVMTEAITNQYGAIGDFQGDAAMGFWGWPRKPDSANSLSSDVQSACQAADKLRERFYQRSQNNGPLAGFACGIGIATGRVVAGRLGTADQSKIGVFGPAVNLAARLESMTKQLGASILMDGQAHKVLKESGSSLATRLRFLGTIQPVGMSAGVRVYELMPTANSPIAMTKQSLKLFEYGRQSFEKGDWKHASEALKQLASDDGPSRFLLEAMERMGTPPDGWNGLVTLTAK